ncbi:MAG: enoyl-CoA hydratase/isomerase family protein [Phycisphaerales bacterium]|nr:enoyl-CoA hydratase/isomerase family protein [Phycisphaerales bacterium]
MPEHVILQFDAPTMTIVLNDPDRRNALSHDVFDDFEQCLDDVDTAIDSESCHVLRIRGEGPAFCAGFDLGAMADGALPSFLERLGAICRRLRHLDAIVVAEVHGPALAGGCALVSACDIVHAGPDAAFGYPVHRLGISPAVSLATLVPGTSPGAARALTLSGESLDADAAVGIGLAAAAHSDRSALSDAVTTLCDRLGAMDAATLRATKRFQNELDGTIDAEVFARSLAASLATADSEEFRARIEAVMHSRRSG